MLVLVLLVLLVLLLTRLLARLTASIIHRGAFITLLVGNLVVVVELLLVVVVRRSVAREGEKEPLPLWVLSSLLGAFLGEVGWTTEQTRCLWRKKG